MRNHSSVSSAYSAPTGTIPLAVELNWAIGSPGFMRNLLLATTAAALALTFAAPAGAEPNKIIPAATTVAPPETTTTDGLVFSKDVDQAKPIDKPGSRMAPSEQADQPTKPVEAAEPAVPTAATPA